MQMQLTFKTYSFDIFLIQWSN